MTASAEDSDREWEGLGPWERAAEWGKANPELVKEMIPLARLHLEAAMKRREDASRHTRRMDLLVWTAGALNAVVGLVNVFVVTRVALTFAPQQGGYAGLTIAGAGTGMALANYAAGSSLSKRLRQRDAARNNSDPASPPGSAAPALVDRDVRRAGALPDDHDDVPRLRLAPARADCRPKKVDRGVTMANRGNPRLP